MRIGIIAGEPSGDVLAAGLMKALRQHYPDVVFEGIGGQYMHQQGFSSLFDMEELSVMGLVEVLRHLPRLLKIKRAVIDHFTQQPPDVFIGVDAPDFNLRVERALKAKGIKTVHYISPTVWAWREGRIHRIHKSADMVLGVFPFEKAVYDKYGVGYKFVGHTMADQIALSPDKRDAKQALGVPSDARALAILPGSRRREVATLLPIFLQTYQCLRQRMPDLRAIIPAATAQRQREIEHYLTEHAASLLAASAVQVTTLPARTAMVASDAVLLASGTATLEAMLCKRPMVACYKLSRFTHWLMKYLYKPQYFSLPNLLADAPLVPELLQEQVNPELISQLLFDQLGADAQVWEEKFLPLHHQLQKNADQSAANAVMELLHG